ncbi:MAG: hypothetical protein ACXVPU_04690 [Bacteroidia bacterium]
MKLIRSNNKLSIPECRKALGEENINYTDDEVLKMRDWLDNMADIALTIIEENGIGAIIEIIERSEDQK